MEEKQKTFYELLKENQYVGKVAIAWNCNSYQDFKSETTMMNTLSKKISNL